MSDKMKVFIRVDTFGVNSNETETWVYLQAKFVIIKSDGSLVDLSPIGSDMGMADVHLEYADSWQEVQHKLTAKIVTDLAAMADLGGVILDPADLRFEFIGG